MPAFQPSTIQTADGQNGIFLDPISNSNGLATYSGNQTDAYGTPVAMPAVLQPTLTVSLARPSKTSRLAKGRMKLVYPKPVMDAGVATAAKSHENSVDITFLSSEKATDTERAQILDLAIAALNNPAFREVFVNNKPMY